MSPDDSQKTIFKNAVEEFLQFSEYSGSDSEVAEVLFEYMDHLYLDESVEEPEDIYVEDLSFYEIDDFLNFYIPDNFEEPKFAQKKAKGFFKRFLKFCLEKRYIAEEDKSDWIKVLS